MTQEATSLETLAKHIQDLQGLVALLRKGQGGAKPWERQLAAHMVGVDRQIQVLRITVSLDRTGEEIRQAAKNVASTCRLSAAALAGSRIDATNRSAMRLVVTLADRVVKELGELQSATLD